MLKTIIRLLREKLFLPTIVTRVVEKAIEANGSAHAAGDIISETDTAGKGTPWIIQNAAKKKGGSGIIHKLQLVTEVESQTFRTAIQVYTKYPNCELDDNAAAASPVAGDEDFFEDEILLPAMISRGDGSYSVATPGIGNLPLAFTCDPDSRDLYLVMIAVDATGFTATERMILKAKIEQVDTGAD